MIQTPKTVRSARAKPVKRYCTRVARRLRLTLSSPETPVKFCAWLMPLRMFFVAG
jgi:hypothetical protein